VVYRDALELQQALRRAGVAGKRRNILLLTGADYHLAQLDAPDVPEAELAQALRWRVKDLIDFPAEEAVVEAMPLPPAPGTQARARIAHAVVARSSRLAEQVGVCDRARFAVSVIDIPETAQRNLAGLCQAGQTGALALLHIGSAGGMITVSADGALYLSRRFDLPPTASAGAADAELSERVLLELQRSLDSFERRFSFLSLGGLHLAAGALSESLAAYLQSHLGMSVFVQDLTRLLRFEGCALPNLSQQAEMFHVLGAMLRDVPDRLAVAPAQH
jgi:MSHA biogenesis protein MshI